MDKFRSKVPGTKMINYKNCTSLSTYLVTEKQAALSLLKIPRHKGKMLALNFGYTVPMASILEFAAASLLCY